MTRLTAPCQGYSSGLPWEVHLKVYEKYCEKYKPQPALIQGNCRGGFALNELDDLLPDWRRLVLIAKRKQYGIDK